MKLSQMFPSKYLQASDLPPGQFVTVTIDEIDYAEFRGDHDEQEISYLLKLREYRKPMKLNRTNATTVSQALRTDDTDEWKGRQVRIFPTTATFGGQTYSVIRVDLNPVHGVPLPPKTQTPTRAPILSAPRGLPEGFDVRRIGPQRAEELTKALAEAGVGYTEFLAWLRPQAEHVWERCHGVALEDLPMGIKPFKDEYLRTVAASAPAAAPENDLAADPDIPF